MDKTTEVPDLTPFITTFPLWKRKLLTPPAEVHGYRWKKLRKWHSRRIRQHYVSLCIELYGQQEREKAKKFKTYEPGYLHIDVTYCPKLDGVKWYLFVAIDRATRLILYELYDAKTAENAEDFIHKCLAFFPFQITHILTDNGLEFTNALLKSKNGKPCAKPSRVDELCKKENIKHRLAKPHTPKTNGMVERANGIIKSSTIPKEQYANKQSMEAHLLEFLVFNILYRRHGSLRRELGVKTPYEAVEKPLVFKNKVVKWQRHFKSKQGSFIQQPCET
ncbi:MAG TPA: DDE-type integrase/transposase/recombinase [Tenuifilaceae bacterium]|nr:DDE-type integrase/transposase/recombinase [Tenuifilaceae bacterium]